MATKHTWVLAQGTGDRIAPHTYAKQVYVDETEQRTMAQVLQETGSNPNLFINGDFQVWQRGDKFTDISFNQYSADRWIRSGNLVSTMEKVNEGIKLTASKTGTYMGLGQRVEMTKNTAAEWKNQPYTLSCCLTSPVGCVAYNGQAISANQRTVITSPCIFTQTDYDVAVRDGCFTWEIGVYKPAIGSDLPVGFTFTIHWAKLERGNKATTFVTRPYAEELNLCRRYYRREPFYHQVYAAKGNIYTFMCSYFPMRIKPTLSYQQDYLHNVTVDWLTSYETNGGLVFSPKATDVCALSGTFTMDAEIY